MNDTRCDLGTTRFILEISGFGRERTISLQVPITGPSLFVLLIILAAHVSFPPFWNGLVYLSIGTILAAVSGHASAIIDEEA
jgi:hypothetical protein